MIKPGLLLAVVASLIGAGIVLSFYGSYVIIEDLARNDGTLEQDQTLEIAAELDPDHNEHGVWAVQVAVFEDDAIYLRLLDPSGGEISSEPLTEGSFEGRFSIEMPGTYRVMVENSGPVTDVMLALGYVPDNSKYAISVAGLYILLVGMGGIVAVMIYTIMRRRAS